MLKRVQHDRTNRSECLALYIHWPFCVSKCPYCDFNSHVRESVDIDMWRAALLADLAHEAALTPGHTLGSIFFGGGTPSLMPPALAGALIDAAAGHWRFAKDIEITLEANPNSVEAAKFDAMASAGVNRISIGIQSFEDDILEFLGRMHSAGEARNALAVAQRNFARVSFDMIYALPGQTVAQWEAQLRHALGFGTDHLSLYQLTIEPGTRFASDVRRGGFTPLDDDAAADLYVATQELTRAAGLPAYEISNHARLGSESRHNLTYWRYGDYVGIGPGAHGRRYGVATERHKKPENFLSAVARNGHGLRAEEVLDASTRAQEALLMGLRLAEGVDLAELSQRTGVSPLVDDAAAARLVTLGLVERRDERLTVTPAGMPLLDAILPEIVAVEADSPAC